MVEVSIEGKMAVFPVRGWHKLWALHSRLEIPLTHIRNIHTETHSTEEQQAIYSELCEKLNRQHLSRILARVGLIDEWHLNFSKAFGHLAFDFAECLVSHSSGGPQRANQALDIAVFIVE
jgi:hypothetical protein